MTVRATRKARLTKRFVELVTDRVVDEVWWDAQLRGFAVRVWPSGQRAFFVRYRNKEGRLRKFTLGRFGPLTVSQARTLAAAKLGEVAQGLDPAAERASYRGSSTVADL